MKIKKLFGGITSVIMGCIPFVSADLIAEPVRVSRSAIGISTATVIVGVVLIGVIVGAVFLIRWIVKRTKNGKNIEVKK